MERKVIDKDYLQSKRETIKTLIIQANKKGVVKSIDKAFTRGKSENIEKYLLQITK